MEICSFFRCIRSPAGFHRNIWSIYMYIISYIALAVSTKRSVLIFELHHCCIYGSLEMTVKVVLDVRYDRFKSSSSSAISLSKYAFGKETACPGPQGPIDIFFLDPTARYQAVHGTAKNRGQGLLVLGGTSNRFC